MTHHPPVPDALAAQRGTGTVEFLICAPIVALLAFGAYDLNKRVEDQQVASILARNAAYIGAAGGPAVLRQRLTTELDQTGATLDAAERTELRGIATRPGDRGLFIDVADGVSPTADALVDRYRTPATVKASDGGRASSYDQVSRVTGDLTLGGLRVLTPIAQWGQNLGLFIEDGVRVASVATSATGDRNGMQAAIATVSDAVHGLDDRGHTALGAPLERRFAGQFYLRAESGYHPNTYQNYTRFGMGLGLTKLVWGAEKSFDDGSSRIQTRCLDRMAANDLCGTGRGPLAALGLSSDPQAERLFLLKIQLIVDAKTVINHIPVVGQAVSALTTALKAIADSVVKAGFQSLVDVAVQSIESTASSAAKSQLTSLSGGLRSAPDVLTRGFNDRGGAHAMQGVIHAP